MAVTAVVTMGTVVAPATAGAGVIELNGTGTPLATAAIGGLSLRTAVPPYNVGVRYWGTNSEVGLNAFAHHTTDFAVTDLPYGVGRSLPEAPAFGFMYVPIAGTGIAFVYDLPGLTRTLQLSSASACAILTGAVGNWDSQVIAADNPGVPLPDLAIRPVTEDDPSGTTYALEAWCIAEQPSLWASFAGRVASRSDDDVTVSATQPGPVWPTLRRGVSEPNAGRVAAVVAKRSGAVGAVPTPYATAAGFGAATPATGTAAVLNASSVYTQPTPVDVTSALTYDGLQPDGQPNYAFTAIGPNVYNPSTFLTMVAPTTGWDPTRGALLSQYLNYTLTLGQPVLRGLGYAPLGLPLEQFGANEVANDVPGAAPITADEENALTCGDLSPSDVAVGRTAPDCAAPDPGTGAPEVPYAIALPIAACAVIAGLVWFRRRRSSTAG